MQELAGRRGVKLLQSSMMTASMRDPRLLPLRFHVTGLIWTHKGHKVQLVEHFRFVFIATLSDIYIALA